VSEGLREWSVFLKINISLTKKEKRAGGALLFYKGILPCFLGGLLADLFCVISNA
jgi:hypothetical protein